MMNPENKPIEARVLALAPTPADAALTRTVLTEAGLACHICTDLHTLCEAFADGAGALLLTEEALADPAADALVAALGGQPPWSDVPILLLTQRQADSPAAVWAMQHLGNLTLLERPVRVAVLISALRAALRARQRQYELRDQLETIRRAQAAEESARRLAEEANRAKDEFLAVVSHELRSPLTAILGWTRLLGPQAPDPPRLQHALKVIERNTHAQLQLIEDLLDTSRIVTGKLRLDVRPVDFASLIEQTLDGVRPMAAAKAITLEVTLDAEVRPISGDAGRLQQVVWNLLTNALKFTPEGGRVTVQLKRRGSQVVLVVRDTGSGLAPDFLPHVFERYRQANAAVGRRYGGLGLGLYLVKQLVELHGGTITAESAGLGQGATFTVTLPIRALETPTVGDASSLTAIGHEGTTALAGLSVLVVGDDKDTREWITTALTGGGARVTAVASAAEAFLVLTSDGEGPRPNLLISDLAMPAEDGFTLMRRVRAWEREHGRSIPAIALTAYGGRTDRMRALEAGFQLYVPKPVDWDELVVAIQNLLQRPPESLRTRVP